MLSEPERERLLRILDANRNRAREALRVVEEHARFVLESPWLAARAKRLRHDLQAALSGVLGVEALGARDVLGDPGRAGGPEAPASAPRAALEEISAANLARAQEALRALEEYLKPMDAAAAEAVSALRFASYRLEQDLLLPRPGLLERAVYVILGPGPGRPELEAQAAACLVGGVRLFQLRHKQLGDRALLALARRLRARLEAEGAWLLLNDRPDLARLAGARGVHVGADDLAPSEARRIVGPGALVGASVHDADELAAALAGEAADYVGFGTLFASGTKPELGAQGLEQLRALAPTCPVPIYGIGGVTVENAAQVIEAGARGVAVSGAVLDAPEPEAAARALVEAVAGALRRTGRRG